MRRREAVLSLGAAALGVAGGGGAGGGVAKAASGSGSPAGPIAPLKERLPAINFSPYTGGQNPDRDPTVAATQIAARLALVAPLARRVRTYGCVAGLEQAPALARSAGLQVSAGAWLGADTADNERQVSNLIDIGRAGQADVLVVGNEVLFRAELPAAAIVAQVRRVKAALPQLRVAYAEVARNWLSSPALIDAVDLVMVNAYPYWDGVAVAEAIPALDDAMNRVRAVAGGKPVQLSETGWPTAGNTLKAAVPTEANAARYLADVRAWAARTGQDDWYWFAAFDEDWKATAEGPQGAHWGLMTADGALKPAFASVLGAG